VKDFYFFFNFFFWTSELRISQAFWEHQARQILMPNLAIGKEVGIVYLTPKNPWVFCHGAKPLNP
jgi:hypothetical protein